MIMAKKRQKKSAQHGALPPEHPATDHTGLGHADESPESLLDRALAAVTQVELLDIVLRKLSVERDEDVGAEPLIAETSPGPGTFGNNPEGTMLYIQPTLSLRGYKPLDGVKHGEPVVRIEATFALAYSCPNVAQIPKDALSAFAMTNAVFTLWPFWRELVMIASLRMRIAPIVVPLLRVRPRVPAEPRKD